MVQPWDSNVFIFYPSPEVLRRYRTWAPVDKLWFVRSEPAGESYQTLIVATWCTKIQLLLGRTIWEATFWPSVGSSDLARHWHHQINTNCNWWGRKTVLLFESGLFGALGDTWGQFNSSSHPNVFWTVGGGKSDRSTKHVHTNSLQKDSRCRNDPVNLLLWGNFAVFLSYIMFLEKKPRWGVCGK